VIQHLDDDGKPCTRHAPPSPQGLLALALLGSRTPSFHHDVASKLQSLMMAIEEISELADTDDVRLAAAGASVTVRDLNTLLSQNRALSRAPKREPMPLDVLVARAVERSGVHMQGDVPEISVEIALPSITHALAIVLDLAAGPLKLGRNVEIATRVQERAVLVITGPKTAMDTLPANANDMIALATFALAREGGELRCAADHFTIMVPLATP
jgi:hypothetical protein